MNAEAMFKELGYKQVRNDSCLIKYEQFINGNCTQITFTLILKKVIATYGYQTSGLYAHDITSDEFRAIVQQEKELGWLEEEKKTEMNIEHYFDDLAIFGINSFAVTNGKPMRCKDVHCDKCDFRRHCGGERLTWLISTFKKPTYKLNQFEYDLLRTNNMSHDEKLKDFATYKNLKEIGYFKDIDFNLTIDEILADCEVVKDEKC